MKNLLLKKLRNLSAGFLACLSFISCGLHAAPGNLSSQPLFLGSNVQANIFFSTDDSGSMDWETTLNDGTWSPGNANFTNLLNPPGAFAGLPANWYPELRRSLCLGFNVLAYNPNTVYTPWKGEDEDGINYTDKSLTTALFNAYDNDNIVDISAHIYYIWTDANNNGQYDGPGSIGFGQAVNTATEECGDISSDNTASVIQVNSLPAILNPGDAGYPNSQQNYANWWTYYRKREYVAKRAMTELVSNSNQRMGLATLHNNSLDGAGVGTPVNDMTVNTNKDALLDAITRIDSTGGTPLRRLLENTGEYFDNAGNNNDHSPLGFTTASPILSQANGGECQQNFAILFSDGFWNGGNPSVGNTDGGTSNSAWDGGSYADTLSNTLADVAMHFYETDLATGLADNIKPIPNVDDNTAQHLTTYTVAFGVNGTLTANPTSTTAPFAWPDPINNGGGERVDDMRHAAWNSRGEFLSARDPDTLISSLEDALASIEDRIGTSTAVTFNSNELQAGSQLYLTQFNSENWSGDLIAFNFNTDGTINPTAAWQVSDYFDSGSYDFTNRIVYTLNDSTNTATTLAWGNISTNQQNDFRTAPDGSLGSITDGQARLNYFLGDRTHEASGTAYDFRQRDSIFGDVVHSGPVFVGVPNEPYPDRDPFGSSTERYSEFQDAQKNRNGIVYVGANDGMLHAFDTSLNGREVMAYVPAELYQNGTATDGLHYLSNPGYTHNYYLDTNIAVNDVYINTSSGAFGSANWTTVLTGAYGAGGKGVFALDVTDETFPNSVAGATSTVLWEFSDADSTYMGFSYSEPRIALLNNGKWAVLFGNGYNSATGSAALIILYIDEGVDGTWSPTDYEIIDTGFGDPANNNGLGQISLLDLNQDFVIDRVYGGDIEGRVWAFDLSDTNENNWDVAYKAGVNKKPLFTAQAGQAITVKTATTRVTTTTSTNRPNVLVIFGTGQYLTTADPVNVDQQSLYGVWDAGISEITEADLVEQTLESFSTPALRVVTDNTVSYNEASPSSGDLGWFFDLPETGERLIVDPVVRLEQVFFATSTPNSQKCVDGGGTGWIMVLDTENGGEPSNGGFDTNADGQYEEVNNSFVAGVKFTNGLPAGLGFLGGSGKLYVTGTGGGSSILDSISTQGIKGIDFPTKGRLSWKELVE
ncbi:MAG: pilus assembly protein [Gammaproteobacteria bacterium]